MQPIYSTIGFIETLRPEKHGLFTVLIDTPTNMTFGWFIELGPIVFVKIKGWRGERISLLKIFTKELVW